MLTTSPAQVTNLTYVTNQLDPVPNLPPRFLDFTHPTGEVHIVAADAATGAPKNIVSCPGRDNEGGSTGTNLLTANVSDHKCASRFSLGWSTLCTDRPCSAVVQERYHHGGQWMPVVRV